jgi:hypothetical protein
MKPVSSDMSSVFKYDVNTWEPRTDFAGETYTIGDSQAARTSEDRMNVLLNNLPMSEWKMQVPGKTRGGRDTFVKKHLTSRKNVKPQLVDEDGRESKSDYEFLSSEVSSSSEEDFNEQKELSEEEMFSDENKEEDDKEFNRLCKMFISWSSADSKIAKFMRHLNPTKVYTKNEMNEMCVKYDIKDISHLVYKKRNESSGYGKILEKTNDTYRLYPQLVEAFEKNFK